MGLEHLSLRLLESSPRPTRVPSPRPPPGKTRAAGAKVSLRPALVPKRGALGHTLFGPPDGSLSSSFIPAGRLGTDPLSPRASSCRIGPRRQGFASPLRALDGSGPIRKTRCLRGERGGAGQGARRGVWRISGESRGSLVHDKGYYHSCLGRTRRKGAFGHTSYLSRGRGALSPAAQA